MKMADFTSGIPSSMRPPIPFPENDDPDMDFVAAGHFTELPPPTTALDTSIVTNSLNFQNTFVSGGHDSFFHAVSAVPDFPGNLVDGFPAALQQNYGGYVSEVERSCVFPELRKRKVVDVAESSSNFVASNSSSSGRGKKMKNSEMEGEKAKVNVVHVRARRGQATDSHSLAERVRRGKINERLRCLQDIVPGCYKTMGLAVMLDEIINYVQSLQNQVEFLSMKLTAASSYYDFNSEPDSVEKMQRAMVAGEAKEMQERKMRKGHGEEVADSFHPTCPWHP